MDKQLAPSTPPLALDLDLPSWLAPSPEDTDLDPDNPPPESEWRSLATPEQLELIRDGSYAARKNREALYDALYTSLLDRVASGQPMTAALEVSAHSIEYGRFMAWVKRDPERLNAYYEAQEAGAEVVAEQMIQIADAADTVEDVQRSTLRINTRKFLLGVWNRKRFGEVRQQDVNVNINMVEAMREANERVERTIDVAARVVNG